MRTYTLKSIAQRGMMLGAAFALLAASVLPAASAFADALNPLTDRSLTLSSGSPGWSYLDGSGNATYAPPNSGANGQKTGNTFDFRVSTDSTGTPVKAFTFQYCTTPAGNCTAPGNNDYTEPDPSGAPGVWERNANGPTEIAAEHSDLEVKVSSPSAATFATYVTNTSGAANQNPDGIVSSVPAANSVGSNFMVYYLDENGTPGDDTDDVWTASAPAGGWAMTVDNAENGDETDGAAGTPKATGWDNKILLTNSTGTGFEAGTRVKVVFFGTDDNYITNPGAGAFFVRMNTYKDDSTLTDANILDGGVTVANVMNLGIQIVTKVLETMDFSVGVVDPYTLAATGSAGSQLANANGHVVHSVCEPILTKMTLAGNDAPNRLSMGDENAEFSLGTSRTYSTHSYFRLSSNSSAGATVYYSGNTLTNTVNDAINAIGDPDGDNISDGAAHAPSVGSEQFGIALDHGTSGPYAVDYNVERASGFVYENGADNTASSIAGGTYGSTGIHSSVTDNGISNVDANASWHSPQLAPLVPEAAYSDGAGVINNVTSPSTPYGASLSSTFAFQPTSMSIPVAIASEDSQVVDCVTGKLRYIANIASTTPAGIYTTKINYIAAPQY
jgi:hypothetical protein